MFSFQIKAWLESSSLISPSHPTLRMSPKPLVSLSKEQLKVPPGTQSNQRSGVYGPIEEMTEVVNGGCLGLQLWAVFLSTH